MPTPITASTLSALLSAALAQKPTRPLVLALDGHCGSGKTTLANGLAAQFPGRWVPLEEGYFAQYGIAESADFVVETTQGGTI